MTLDDVVILTDQQIREIYYDVYNGFWRMCKGHVPDPDSDEWEQITGQARQMLVKHRNCPMVQHMIQDLLDQLEARSRKGAAIL